MDAREKRRGKRSRAFTRAALVSLALLCGLDARGLNPARAMSQYIRTVWNSEGGLPQNSVHAIAQTRDGYLWMGTEEGIARFDGTQFKVFDTRNTRGLASDYISSLAASDDGSLWIGTDDGLSHFVPAPGSTETTLANSVLAANFTSHNGLAGDWVTALQVNPDGSLWVGTTSGLSLIRGGQVVAGPGVLAGADIEAIVSDRQRRIWIGTDRGLFEIDHGRFVDWRSLVHQAIVALAPAPDGSIWVGTLGSGLLHFKDGRALPEHAVLGKEISALLFDHDGALWMAFPEHGWGRLFQGRFSMCGVSEGLPTNRTTRALFEDHEGNLWIGSIDKGIVQLRDGKFSVFGTPEGLAGNYVDSVLQSRDGTMWIGSDSDGLNHLFPDGKVEIWNSARGLPHKAITSIAETRVGDLWVGFRTGEIAQIHDRHVRIYQDPDSKHAAADALYEDRDGTLWVGFYGAGVGRFRDGHVEHLTRTGRVTQITQTPDGAIWWGADDEAVFRFFNDTTQRFTTTDGLPSNHVMCLYADADGDLWVGTASGGLSRIHNGNVASWTPEQGLPEPTVGSIIEDNHQNLWVGGDAGVYSLPKSALNASRNIDASSYRVYGVADGLRSRETVYGCMPSRWKDKAGRLWFATIEGAAVIDPDHLQFAAAPPVWIESVTFDGRPMPLHSGEKMGPWISSLEFGFTSPSFSAPLNVRFRYKLMGFDRNWIDAGNRRRAWYTNLAPGAYTFVVQAANSDGVWNTAGDSFSFVLRPPLSRTPLAYAAYVLLIVLAAWVVVALRTRTLMRREIELRRLVSERTAQLEEEKRVLEATRQELQVLATHDSLTGLFNRAAIIEHLAREVYRAARDETPLGVLITDLDYFKQVNDRYGHLRGDDVIREAATRLQNAMRKYDIVGRYGGEEFLILIPGWNPETAPHRIDSVLEAIRRQPFSAGDGTIAMTCSVGVSVYRPGIDSPELPEILGRADAALYAAKSGGRNCARVDHPDLEPFGPVQVG